MSDPAFTEEDYAAFEAYMTRRTGTRVVDHADSKVVALLHHFMELGGVGGDTATVSTTLGTMIYLAPIADPALRAEVLTHECQHGCDFATRGLDLFWFYARSEGTAETEARAVVAAQEFRWALERATIDPRAYRGTFCGMYAVDDAHDALAVRLIEQGLITARLGVQTTAAGKFAATWVAEWAVRKHRAGG